MKNIIIMTSRKLNMKNGQLLKMKFANRGD